MNYLMPLMLGATLLSVSAWLAPHSLPLKSFPESAILELLASMFVVALFLERALEVFVDTWRGPGAEKLDLEFENEMQNIARFTKLDEADPGSVTQELKNAQTELEGRKRARAEYKCQTHRLALWLGFAFGLLISAVGMRILSTLIVLEALERAPEMQRMLFNLTDVLLTGGLIAGGSDALHKLANVYTSFMESARQSTQPAPRPQS